MYIFKTMWIFYTNSLRYNLNIRIYYNFTFITNFCFSVWIFWSILLLCRKYRIFNFWLLWQHAHAARLQSLLFKSDERCSQNGNPEKSFSCSEIIDSCSSWKSTCKQFDMKEWRGMGYVLCTVGCPAVCNAWKCSILHMNSLQSWVAVLFVHIVHAAEILFLLF